MDKVLVALQGSMRASYERQVLSNIGQQSSYEQQI